MWIQKKSKIKKTNNNDSIVKKSTPEIFYLSIFVAIVSLNLYVTKLLDAKLWASPDSQDVGGSDGNFSGIIKK